MAEKKSALASLKALANKKAPEGASTALATQLGDPAISGAKRDKNVVRLGFDPTIAERAALAAGLKEALERAESEFKILQGEMRDYGAKKRGIFNDTFKSDVTTVCVPFLIENSDTESDTPGRETHYVQVICSNKYSVQKDMVLGNKDTIGASLYGKLFVEEITKTLKPNAEEMFREILKERCDLDGEELDGVMNVLFDTDTKVATAKNYESEIKSAPEEIQTILAQAVTRSAPGLKFQ